MYYRVFEIFGIFAAKKTPLPTRTKPTQHTQQQSYTTHKPNTESNSSFIIHHSPIIIHHSPFIIHHSSFTIHHSPFTIHHSPFIIHHSSFIIRQSSFIIHHSSFNIQPNTRSNEKTILITHRAVFRSSRRLGSGHYRQPGFDIRDCRAAY